MRVLAAAHSGSADVTSAALAASPQIPGPADRRVSASGLARATKMLVEAGVSKYAADDRPGRSGSRTLGDLVAWRYCRWTQEDDHDA